MNTTSSQPCLPGRVLFVSHEASRTGAPMFLLHFLRWLKGNTNQAFDILVRRDGPLQADFAAIAPVLSSAQFEANPDRIREYALIYSNTVCNALFLSQFNLEGVPVMSHVHELDYGVDVNGARNFAEVMRHTDHYVACAGAVADQLVRRFQLGPTQVSIHYEIFDPRQTDANAARAQPGEVRRQHGIPEHARVIAACGTLDQRKGADLFVAVAARMNRLWTGNRPLHFVWIGKASDQLLVQLLQHDVRRAGLAGKITFAGEQANPHALLGLADIFCLTSREDPFPLVMLEATALGKPLLCFAGSGGAGELCALGAGEAVPFLDVAAMADRALALLQDEPSRRALAEAGSAVVRQRFVPDAVSPVLWQDVVRHVSKFEAAASAGRWNQSLASIYAGWPEGERPQSAYVQAAIRRSELRDQARGLVRAGRNRDAAHLLVRGITQAVEVKDAFGLIEAIIEFAGELASLDPVRAETLVAQGERLLRGVSPTVELVRCYQRGLAAVRAKLSAAASTARVA